jgi:predicted dehydrogenase
VKFGLVGVGGIGGVRAAALAVTPGAELVAVHDLDAVRAAKAAPAARFFSTAKEMLEWSGIDAVIISTPPQYHHDLAVQALAAGKHVLVEKPMAATVEECRSMQAAAAKANRFLSVGFNHRYFKALKLMRDTVRSGVIGPLTHVRAYAGHTGLSEFKAPWMYDVKVMGGGALMDNGIHVLDLMRYVMGDFTEVYGYKSTAVWGLDGAEDNALALFRSSTGVLGSLQASWGEWKGYRFHVEAYGPKGMVRAYYAPMMATVITMDKPGGAKRVARHFYPGDIIREKVKGWQSTVIATFVEEFTDFMALARGEAGSGRIATGADGLRAVEVAKAVYQSGESGKAVQLAQL